MTFDDDFARLNLSVGTYNVPLTALGLEWPPPERLWLDGKGARPATTEDDPNEVMVRMSLSQLTDEQRERMTHVCRGAEYRYAEATS